MSQKPIAIFRTKNEILLSREINGVRIADEVIQDPVFICSKLNDLLGFKVVNEGNCIIVSVKSIKNNPQDFLELAFGESNNKIIT